MDRAKSTKEKNPPPSALRFWVLPIYSKEEDKLPLEHDPETAKRIFLHRFFVVGTVLVLDLLLLGLCNALNVGGFGLIISGLLMLAAPFVVTYQLNRRMVAARRRNSDSGT